MSEQVDEMLDIEVAFRPVVAQYGRSMFALVMNAGMCGQAAQVLGGLVEKHQSLHSAQALRVIADAFNQVSNAYVKQMGWTEELVAQCDRDVQRAFAGKIIVAGPGQTYPGFMILGTSAGSAGLMNMRGLWAHNASKHNGGLT